MRLPAKQTPPIQLGTSGGWYGDLANGLLAAAYCTVYGIAAAYITARLAPGRPMLQALVLGFLGLAASAMGAVVTWNRVPSMGPHWYPLALIALALPPAWLGGMLRLMRLRGPAGG